MSSIYDKLKRKKSSYLDDDDLVVSQPAYQYVAEEDSDLQTNLNTRSESPRHKDDEVLYKSTQGSLRTIPTAASVLNVIDDVVLKQYLTKLDHLDLIPQTKQELGRDVILYKITKLVYEKDEFASEKFISAISAMTYADCSIFLIIDGFKDHTDFYIGIKSTDEEKTTRSIAETFKSSIEGQFPGISMEDCSNIEVGKRKSQQDILLETITDASSVSSYVGVPSYKDEDGRYTNTSYVQGVEKLAVAMQGKRYTAVILASNITSDMISQIRSEYEDLYTKLSAKSSQQLTYTTNESLANAMSRSKGYSDSTSESRSEGVSHTDGTSSSHTDGTSSSHTYSESTTNKSKASKAGSIFGGALAAIGGVLAVTGIGTPIGLGMIGGGAALGAAGASGKTTTKGTSDTNGENHSDTKGESHSDTTSRTYTHGKSHSEQFQETNGQTATVAEGKSFAITLHNKHIEELQKRIDKQLDRIAMSESTGLWSAATYFLSYDNDVATAETGAAIFKSIMQGESSGVEVSTVNTWYGNNNNSKQIEYLTNSICCFKHPLFLYQRDAVNKSFPIENSSLISSKELSMMLSLPRKSVPGLPVVDYATLAKEVVRYNDNNVRRLLPLGCIFDLGVEHVENRVGLDANSLTQHVFVTGSTGCGKSETVYKLISEAKKARARFLIIEPAKGEYKNVFGDANVYGTNPELTKLLRINPFRFPKGIHVLEHIDRIAEIFNVCWPMYAAMPAVLKKAMLKSYEKCGWDLYRNTNASSDNHDLFPSFADLLLELENAINSSAYSDEVKGNYIGSLVTRVESLTNGINGEIFSANEISEEKLFDENTIVDLSRVGSQETKSLIMGILTMRLSEYRMASAKCANSALKHITVLEEAHNILKRVSTQQSMEGSNVAGKSVEMITNAIAEMRTYGEGFIIVDQSPSSVDQAAIKNTNTKIIMRLPDGDDRLLAGKAAGLKDNQVDEIAKLQTGVGVVYQNDWVSPVLCKIDQYTGERIAHTLENEDLCPNDSSEALTDVISFLMKGRIKEEVSVESIDNLNQKICSLGLPTQLRISLTKLVKEYSTSNKLSIWNEQKFSELAKLVTRVLGLKSDVERVTSKATDWNELNEQLSSLIQDKVVASESLDVNLRQCLMEDWALGNSTRREIADVWAKDLRESLQ
jgi:hypothetical protein